MTRRGRTADKPREIPARGWWEILKRVGKNLNDDNAFLVAAGLAFYALLSLFPALIATVSIYGLVADPAMVEQQVAAFSEILPGDVRALLADQLHQIVVASPTSLSLSVVVSLLVTLWSISTGVTYLMQAFNIAYNERETRNFLKLRATALAFTLGAILFVSVSIALIAVLPAVLNFVGMGGYAELLIRASRWPLLAVAVILGLAVLSRYAPDRKDPKWRWVTPGAVVVTVLWLALSAAFSFYVSNFGNYNETYGSLGAVVALMTWFYLTAFLVLVGAEINAETEHQTAKDTTEGRPKPMGQRGAQMADTLPAPT